MYCPPETPCLQDDYPVLRILPRDGLQFLDCTLTPTRKNPSKSNLQLWQHNCSIHCIARLSIHGNPDELIPPCVLCPSPKEPSTHVWCGRRIECSFPTEAFQEASDWPLN